LPGSKKVTSQGLGQKHMATSASFEPRILGILCNWCSYSGADGAGQQRLEYPPNIDVVRVMCTGRVDPRFILEAFAKGMDGVLVCGCHPGDCHYINGNCKAIGRFELLKGLLRSLNIEEGRLRLEWVSASESARYADLVSEMVEQVRALGPFDPAPWPSPNEGVSA
jgi:F420-non-reducing hydrogenase iron-sulfur subunit